MKSVILGVIAVLFFCCFAATNAACGGQSEAEDGTGVIAFNSTVHVAGTWLVCEWIIPGIEGQVVRVTVEHADIEYAPQCGYDYLSLWDGHYELEVCGYGYDPLVDGPCVYVANGSQDVTVRFLADLFTTGEGFEISYDHVEPGSEETNCTFADIARNDQTRIPTNPFYFKK